MTDKIKEKLLRGCGDFLIYRVPSLTRLKACQLGIESIPDVANADYTEFRMNCGGRYKEKIILCNSCKLKLQQHEETKKSLIESFNKCFTREDILKLKKELEDLK